MTPSDWFTLIGIVMTALSAAATVYGVLNGRISKAAKPSGVSESWLPRCSPLPSTWLSGVTEASVPVAGANTGNACRVPR